MMMKYFMILWCGVCMTVWCSAAGVTLEAVHDVVRLGEYVQLALVSDKQVTGIDYPVVKNARWAKNFHSNQIRNINGKVTYIRVIALVPEKAGTVTVPPFKVRIGKQNFTTGEVKVKVNERKLSSEQQENVKIADVVLGKLTLQPAGREIFAGENIVLHLDLLVDERFANQIRVGYYPELQNVADAVFTSYNTRQGKSRFTAGRPRRVEIKDRMYLRYRFTASCRVLKPGRFAPSAICRVGVIQSRNESRDPFGDPFGDSFFSSFFSGSNVEPYTVQFASAAPAIIKALPPPPSGALNTGLVGKWEAAGKLSTSSMRVGEVAELQLTFKGKGEIESFSAPELKLTDFRVYSPEVVRKPGEISAKYAIIPLKSGEQQLKFRVCTFDPEKQDYVIRQLKFSSAVSPGNVKLPHPPSPQPAADLSPAAKESAKAETAAPRQELFYQKSSRGRLVKVPLLKNNLWYILFFLICFPVLALVINGVIRRGEQEKSDPDIRRRKELRREIAGILPLLKQGGSNDLVRSRVLPLLGEKMGLSAGVTPGEAAGKVADPELQKYLADLDSAGFIPGGGKDDVPLSPAVRSKLLKLLKKMMIFFCFAALSLAGSDMNAAFNRGDFQQAAQIYKEAAAVHGGFYPDMLYNYGNALYYLNRLPEARAALLRASLLKPGDREIKGNLEAVNGKLLQSHSRSGSFSAWLEVVRDRFRPDQYLLAAAVIWALLWMVWSFRRKIGSGVYMTFSGTGGFIILLCLICFFTQLRSSYIPERGVIITSEVEMRTLPGINSGRVESTIPGGGDALIVPPGSSGFSRIRISGREGWVPEKSVEPMRMW